MHFVDFSLLVLSILAKTVGQSLTGQLFESNRLDQRKYLKIILLNLPHSILLKPSLVCYTQDLRLCRCCPQFHLFSPSIPPLFITPSSDIHLLSPIIPPLFTIPHYPFIIPHLRSYYLSSPIIYLSSPIYFPIIYHPPLSIYYPPFMFPLFVIPHYPSITPHLRTLLSSFSVRLLSAIIPHFLPPKIDVPINHPLSWQRIFA